MAGRIAITQTLNLQMSCIPSSENIVKTGTFLYDGSILCDVCIAYSSVRFGNGDYEDSSDIGGDVEIDAYYVFFGSTTERGKYKAGGGGYPSLAQAVTNVEDHPGFGKSVKWDA
jgi:hypothetical protein